MRNALGHPGSLLVGRAPLLKEPLLSTAQVAQLLGLSPKTIQRLVARGSLPCYHIGRLVRFAPGDVFRWLEARKEA
jgi:excisionase family DNA binding protein